MELKENKRDKLNVLLIQPAPKDVSIGDALPIGLASIASFLRKHGINVKLVDLGKQRLTKDFIPEVVGIGASTPYAKNALKTSKKVRKYFPQAKVVMGGHHFSALPDEAFPYADAVIRGEGEMAMLDICREGIKEKIVTGKLIQDLDDIPMFDEDLLDIIYKGRETRLHIVGARGCPFNCVFCSEHTKQIRYHSVDYFVDYLEILAKRYHNNIFISDDVFTVNVERSTRICEEILRRNLDLKLRVFGHITTFNKDLLLIMKKAGVHTVSYGIESGNDVILKLVDKKFTTEKALEVIRKTEEAGLTVNCLYMVGNIGETKETIADTVSFALKASKERWCSIAIPFPGTLFAEVADQYGTVLTKDWNKYTNQNTTYLPRNVTEKYMKQARDTIVGWESLSLLSRVKRKLGF